MSFGRRLALFFLLIAIVPTTALIAILLFVSSDSQRGKADARLAAGLQTAVAVYDQHTSSGAAEARRLAVNPQLASAIKAHDTSGLQAFVRQGAHQPGVVAVRLDDKAGHQVAASGPASAVAFGRVGLTVVQRSVGALLVSETTAAQFTQEVHRLTERDLVVTRDGATLAATVPPPTAKLNPDQTANVDVAGRTYRAHLITLSSADHTNLLLLGPTSSEGLFGVGRPVLAILVWFLVAAVVLAWALARTLTRLHERVETQAVTDPLTGLWNRRYMADTLDREVSRALRFGHPISLIIVDIDDFKKINDREGHMQGDMILEAVADAVRDATRSIDVAARYGGDELALILVETDRAGATILAERLAEQMRETEVPGREGGSMGATISAGVATIPDSAEDLPSLVDAADRALLRAKRAGKDQIRTAPVTRPGAKR